MFTIGHSNHPMEGFVKLLKQHEITSVVDIRRYPASRKFPHFNREQIQATLKSEGIDYHWFEALGGRRRQAKDDPPSPNLGLRNESFRAYADYMITADFRQAVGDLLTIAGSQLTTIMCAEALFWQCHRRLISDYLVANGASVQHLFSTGDVRTHSVTEGVQVSGDTVTYPESRPLFDNR
ncbi:MAG: DUF488 domain-containing protein [Pirellulaceae bacterium]